MAVRTCAWCGSRLAAPEGADDRCPLCARLPADPWDTAPVRESEFWQRPALRDALEQRHIGRVIRAYRREHDPLLPQAVVARWLGLTQSQISRIEHANSPVHDLLKLDRWARALHIPDQLLWFRLIPQPLTAEKEMDTAATVPSQAPAGEGDDVDRRAVLKATAGAALPLGAVAARTPGSSLATPSSRHRIGPADIEAMREMTAAFRRLDNKFGGGHAQRGLHSYLDHAVMPMVKEGTARAGVEQQLLLAVAELHHLAGWMAADIGQRATADTYLGEALRYARGADNHAFAAEVLAGMSHHVSYVGDGRRAVELAQAATASARGAGLRSLSAEAAVMEAHGHAILGNIRLCSTALRRAEQQFSAGEDQDRPKWLSYFDRAYLAAKLGHVFRALGQVNLAERYAIRSLQMSDGYDRGRLFNTVLLASIYADKRELEAAVSFGVRARSMADSVASTRTIGYLEGLANQLKEHASYRPARQLIRQIDELKADSTR